MDKIKLQLSDEKTLTAISMPRLYARVSLLRKTSYKSVSGALYFRRIK
jgi:hypothetical protein